MSRAQGQARELALPALLELVRLKAVKEELENLNALLVPTQEEVERTAALLAEYKGKVDAAWACAKAVFQRCPQCHRKWDHDCYYVICGRVKERR